MVNYNLGKIYKIVDNTNGNIYIGSTCEPTLAKRLTKHVGNYKCYLNGKGNYVSSFKVLENNDYSMILIEDYSCERNEQLLSRERYWQDELKCVNTRQAGLKLELGQKEYDKQQHKKYDEKHKEEICRCRSAKHQCVCGIQYTIHHKLRHERTARHQKYIENIKWFTIRKGLDMIRKLDNHFANQ